MGIQADLQAKVAAALDSKLSDTAVSFTYTDPLTDDTTTGRGWREVISHYEADGESVQVSDLKLGMLQNEWLR